MIYSRGAEIRTRDLTDPNGARYQAALRPEEANTTLLFRVYYHALDDAGKDVG